MTKVIPGQPLPDTVPLDVSAWVDSMQRAPTHLVAVHSDNEAATLYAVHGPVLALQCVSIPFLPASKETHQNGVTTKHMPTLALRVPSVQHFNTILRWFYSQSTTSLLHELIPLKHIVTYLTKRSLARRHSTSADAVKTESAPAVDVTRLSQVDLVEAMSTLSTKVIPRPTADHPGSMEERRRARHCLVQLLVRTRQRLEPSHRGYDRLVQAQGSSAQGSGGHHFEDGSGGGFEGNGKGERVDRSASVD